MDDPADEALIQEILPVLDVDHQYTRLVEAWTTSLSPRSPLRPGGRQATGYKIRTLTSDAQQRDDRRIAVWVVVTRSNLDDEDRIRETERTVDQRDSHQRLG